MNLGAFFISIFATACLRYLVSVPFRVSVHVHGVRYNALLTLLQSPLRARRFLMFLLPSFFSPPYISIYYLA